MSPSYNLGTKIRNTQVSVAKLMTMQDVHYVQCKHAATAGRGGGGMYAAGLEIRVFPSHN